MAIPRPNNAKADVNNDDYIEGEGQVKLNDNESLIKKDKIYRIVISLDEELQVNMVYTEIGDDDYEVFGSFSGGCGGGGLFHQNKDSEITVSDDFGEFDAAIGMDKVELICKELDRLRTDFEEYDGEGNLLGFSDKGFKFLSKKTENEDGYLEVYSEDASEDFIYDVQDDWNLNFYKN